MDAITDVPFPVNEPVHDYAPGSAERARLTEALTPSRRTHRPAARHRRRAPDGYVTHRRCPAARHAARLGLTNAEHADATAAIEAAMAAKADWEATPFDERAAVFLRAADLLAGPWREKLAAATMLGQSKTAYRSRDRHAVRTDRLLAVQRRCPADPGGAADQQPRRVEPHGPPAAGWLCLRDHTVQFHRHCRQSADRPALMGNTVIWKPSPLRPSRPT